MRALIRSIVASRVYQQSSQPSATNEDDTQNYSRAWFKRLDAEVLLDAVCQVTGVEEKFSGLPRGYRAIEVWDSKLPHYFLRLFGRPTRESACQCERNVEPSVAQVLHLLNSPQIDDKLRHPAGRVARLSAGISDDAALADELYLAFYSRFPTSDERRGRRSFARGSRPASRCRGPGLEPAQFAGVRFQPLALRLACPPGNRQP